MFPEIVEHLLEMFQVIFSSSHFDNQVIHIALNNIFDISLKIVVIVRWSVASAILKERHNSTVEDFFWQMEGSHFLVFLVLFDLVISWIPIHER